MPARGCSLLVPVCLAQSLQQRKISAYLHSAQPGDAAIIAISFSVLDSNLCFLHSFFLGPLERNKKQEPPLSDDKNGNKGHRKASLVGFPCNQVSLDPVWLIKNEAAFSDLPVEEHDTC